MFVHFCTSVHPEGFNFLVSQGMYIWRKFGVLCFEQLLFEMHDMRTIFRKQMKVVFQRSSNAPQKAVAIFHRFLPNRNSLDENADRPGWPD
jgi:hypothetical protein